MEAFCRFFESRAVSYARATDAERFGSLDQALGMEQLALGQRRPHARERPDSKSSKCGGGAEETRCYTDPRTLYPPLARGGDRSTRN
jgi:hypothetical protein